MNRETDVIQCQPTTAHRRQARVICQGAHLTLTMGPNCSSSLRSFFSVVSYESRPTNKVLYASLPGITLHGQMHGTSLASIINRMSTMGRHDEHHHPNDPGTYPVASGLLCGSHCSSFSASASTFAFIVASLIRS
jgi:hypothetical protein